jgi:hypothetical protein
LIEKNIEFVLTDALKDQFIPVMIFLIFSTYLYRWNLDSCAFKMEHGRLDKASQREEFIYDMRVVRGNRFNFSKRLERKSQVKAFMVNVLSVISIFVSTYLLANASGISEEELKKVSVAIIGLSLLALWMSLDTPSSELLRKATDAHQCGREISEIYRAFKFEMIDISEATKKYEEVLSKYKQNHDQLDRVKTLYDDRGRHSEKSKGLMVYNTIWPYYISCYSPVWHSVLWCIAIFGIQFVFPL